MPRITRRFTLQDGRRNQIARARARRQRFARDVDAMSWNEPSPPRPGWVRRPKATFTAPANRQAAWLDTHPLSNIRIWQLERPAAERVAREAVERARLFPTLVPAFQLAIDWTSGSRIVRPWMKTLWRIGGYDEHDRPIWQPYFVPGCFQREALDEMFGRDVTPRLHDGSWDRVDAWLIDGRSSTDALVQELRDRERHFERIRFQAAMARLDGDYERAGALARLTRLANDSHSSSQEDITVRQRAERVARTERQFRTRASAPRVSVDEDAAKHLRQTWLRSSRGRSWQANVAVRERSLKIALVREIVQRGGDPRSPETVAWVRKHTDQLGRARGYETCLAKLRAHRQLVAAA